MLYRPISLFCIIYKIFASILLERLLEAGAEKRIWATQFGFKRGVGTADALFIIRRIIDRLADDPKLNGIFLALDWAKAFDSIAPTTLIEALQRFGLPQDFTDMIAAIYSDRIFRIEESGISSAIHTQAFGISQGCPLSPFLFTILMSVLMADAHDDLLKDYGITLNAPLLVDGLLYSL